ncbi:hypothetical protein QSV08_07605 [Maribacter sp. BPC-D8]|uniref:hypothetical protein n=1 Tax=Maribacter sp. BPC-D8 TaxID=3053613 RepID=UPI002B48C47F|nr:hypothetical protein [Maribacter sp. BPC-D8]WRI31109.1 hypothetical protein QSV08_07605 [Maribacter sp. BPC-D8]
MKKILLIFIFIPVMLLAQTENLEVQETISQNSALVEQFAQLAPMGVNPYLTVFLTSVCSKVGFHNDFVATNPFFGSWIVLILFGLLFFFTSLVGTVFKTNKATATIGLVDTYLSNKAALIVNAIIILAPTFISDDPAHSEIVYQAGFLSVSLKTILILGISLYFLIIVMAFKFFIDILIFLSPIPFIDAVLEIVKIVIATGFIFISIISPVTSVIIALMMFLVSLFFYKRSIRLISKTKYLIVYPLLNLFRSKETKLTDGKNLSILVLTNTKIGKLKKGVIVRLQETDKGIHLIQKRFLFSNITQEIELSNFHFNQNHLDTIMSNEDEQISLVLNRSYHKYLDELSEKYNIEIRNRKELKINLKMGFIKKVKGFFNKSDIAELKSIGQ